MFPTLPPLVRAHETVPAMPVTTIIGEAMPDLSGLTLDVIDLSDTGHFQTEDPAVLVWLATVSEAGVVW